jgi:predicted deacetylase
LSLPALPTPAICVSIHDVAPATWPRCEVLIAALARVAPVRLTLLVVPNYHRHGAGLPPWYRSALTERLAAGDELALHGFYHLDESPPPGTPADWWRRRVMTAGEGEFAALTLAAARRRLCAGREWFARESWPVCGFVAPAWQLGRGAWHAVANSTFAYTTTTNHFHLLHPWQRVAAPVWTWSTRTGVRRALSLLWNGMRPVASDAPLLRLGLHPDDALHPKVVRQAQHLLEVLLHEREAMTKNAFAATLRPAPAGRRAERAARPAHTGVQTGGAASSDSAAILPPRAAPTSTSLG